MNVVYFNADTKIVSAIIYNPEVLPETGEGIALTTKDMPCVELNIGEEKRCYYNVETDSFTHEVIERPLTIDEKLEVALEEIEQLKIQVNQLLGN